MMAGAIRLFEKINGLLVEVDPATSRDGRRVSHVNLSVDVLWTADEEAAALVEQQAETERQVARQLIADFLASQKAVAMDKLAAIGLDAADIKALLA